MNNNKLIKLLSNKKILPNVVNMHTPDQRMYSVECIPLPTATTTYFHRNSLGGTTVLHMVYTGHM